ncbi:MAG: PAS-domain containing protein, partial [Rhodospirillales bacterium]
AEAEDALKRNQDELEDRVTARTEEVATKTELLKTVLDSLSDGIVAFDKDLRLIAANDRLHDIRGYPKEMVTEGTPFEDFMRHDVANEEFGPGDPEKINREKIHKAGQFLSHEFERQRPDGSYIEVRGGPIPGGGFVSTYTDITERKDAEDLRNKQVAELDDARKATLNMMEDAEGLRKRAEGLRDEAEAATKAKASFLATMSHEIRTPMNGIIGMVDMLVQTKLEDDQRQMMRTVRDSAYALLTIINDILDFSKIEAGKLEMEAIPLSIRDVVEGVSETLAPNANKKGIKINIHVDPNIPDAVLGDQVRIRQVLFNIAGNAVKFTDEGRVLIRAFLVPSKTKEKVTVRFEIIDFGIGISKEAQAELFKEFSQAESSTTRRFGGTGLGLSISQRLVEMMKGEIEVESELGEGSKFIVTLTLPAANDHAIKSDGQDLSGLNILFASSDVEESELDASILRHWGASVAVIKDIAEMRPLSLEVAGQGTPFDIIVMDGTWPREARIAEIKAVQDEKDLAKTRFALYDSGRSKAEREDIANTVYIESNPLRRASFVHGVAVAAGRASPDISYEDDEIIVEAVEVLSVEEAEAAGTLILVAEDNPTNRDVIGRQLKLLGYTAEFGDDGKQALKAWKSKSFAMLLTDCHMPEMDGFELTQAIRKTEKGRDHQFPIVAITASTLEAEVERCYEAGMSDFLAKPLEMPKLKAALKKWMPVGSGPVKKGESEPIVESPEPSDSGDDPIDSPIDPNALKSVFGDDEGTFKEILQDFIEPANNNIGEIQAAFAEHSADGVAKAAHKLKSSSRSVGAMELADICLALEMAGKADDWDEIKKAEPRLTGVMDSV